MRICITYIMNEKEVKKNMTSKEFSRKSRELKTLSKHLGHFPSKHYTMKDRSIMKSEAYESYSAAQLLKPKKKVTDYKW